MCGSTTLTGKRREPRASQHLLQPQKVRRHTRLSFDHTRHFSALLVSMMNPRHLQPVSPIIGRHERQNPVRGHQARR